jgi:PAS domain-containing protein
MNFWNNLYSISHKAIAKKFRGISFLVSDKAQLRVLFLFMFVSSLQSFFRFFIAKDTALPSYFRYTRVIYTIICFALTTLIYFLCSKFIKHPKRWMYGKNIILLLGIPGFGMHAYQVRYMIDNYQDEIYSNINYLFSNIFLTFVQYMGGLLWVDQYKITIFGICTLFTLTYTLLIKSYDQLVIDMIRVGVVMIFISVYLIGRSRLFKSALKRMGEAFEEEQRWREIMHMLPEGIIGLDKKRDVAYFNDKILSIFDLRGLDEIDQGTAEERGKRHNKLVLKRLGELDRLMPNKTTQDVISKFYAFNTNQVFLHDMSFLYID